MKYVFIINPNAGKGNFSDALIEKVKDFFEHRKIPYDIHLTTGVGDATVFAEDYPIAKGETICFVACGGDGTFNETVNGGFGRSDAQFAVMPLGSGNDFIKCLGPCFDDFLDFEKLTNGTVLKLDALKCDDRICVNLCNIGIDSVIAQRMEKFKHIPGVSGHMAYNISTAISVFGKLGKPMKITFDDGEIIDDELTLSAFGNGICYGGGYFPTPEAKPDDGLIDFCCVKKVNLLKVSKLIGIYKAGKHINNPALANLVTFRRCKAVKIESPVNLSICIDGETKSAKSLSIKLLPASLPMRIPLAK